METGSVKELEKDLVDQSIDLISKGKTKEGIEKVQSPQAVMKGLVLGRTVWINEILGVIAEERGEERVFDYWRQYALRDLANGAHFPVTL